MLQVLSLVIKLFPLNEVKQVVRGQESSEDTDAEINQELVNTAQCSPTPNLPPAAVTAATLVSVVLP